DPLSLEGVDHEHDGKSRWYRPGLPRVPIPLTGTMNGGYEYEFFSYAEIGDRIKWRSRYNDIIQKNGRSGSFVLVMIEDEYATTSGRPLLKAINAALMR